jgi:hypothetical protein
MTRLLGPDLRTFCVECQASACIHVVVALDDAEATLAQQQARFEATERVLGVPDTKALDQA